MLKQMTKDKKLFLGIGAVLFVVALLIPMFVKTPYILQICIMTFYIGSASMAWNVLGGMTGQTSLGHACFMAIGAYTATLLLVNLNVSPWLGALASMLVTGIIATLLFTPCFGLRGPYFSLATLAFAEAIRNIFINWKFVRGAQGITLPFGEDSFVMMRFFSKVPYYYIAFAMLIIISLIVFAIDRSRLGYALKTVREDEDTANAIGINPQKYKAIAVFISAALTGLTGCFYSQYLRYIDPDIMLQTYSIEFVLPAVIGGVAFVGGPLLGAVLLIPLSELLRANLSSILPGINIIVYAVVLIAIIMVQPKGLLGWYQNRQIEKKRREAIEKMRNDKEAAKQKAGGETV